jgi:lipoprotein-anchoring transpeptidase ErfK/SrfK
MSTVVRAVSRSAPALAVAGALALLVLAGCGSSARQSEHSHQRPVDAGLGLENKRAVTIARRCASPKVAPTYSQAFAAVVVQPTAVYGWPSVSARVVTRFQLRDRNGFPVVFGVLASSRPGKACGPAWLRVLLPTRPNGSAAWVPARAVSVYPVNTRVEVDLSQRQVSVYRWGELAFRTGVAVGASATPTPVGRYYVDERFRLASANGPFGVAALGISAHSDALKNWVQGGPVALHGTDDPRSIGRAVSHGCVRLPNAVMTRLFAIAPAGTPVLIRR